MADGKLQTFPKASSDNTHNDPLPGKLILRLTDLVRTRAKRFLE
jgi:hypothetical protein